MDVGVVWLWRLLPLLRYIAPVVVAGVSVCLYALGDPHTGRDSVYCRSDTLLRVRLHSLDIVSHCWEVEWYSSFRLLQAHHL